MADKYLTPEEHHALKSTNRRSKTYKNPILMVVVALVLLVIGFGSGIAYQKSQHTLTPVTTASSSLGASGGFGGGYGGGRGRFGGQRPTFGPVTTISSSSITVSDQTTGNNMTFTITSSTAITDNGQTVSTSDITVGETVAVIPTAAGSSTASRILVNPSFGDGEPTTSPPSAGLNGTVVQN